MKTKIYIVSFASWNNEDYGTLHLSMAPATTDEQEARKAFEENIEYARRVAANEEDDLGNGMTYDVTVHQYDTDAEISRETDNEEERYAAKVLMDVHEIDTDDSDEDDYLRREPVEEVKMGLLRVFFNDREQYERAKTIYDSEGPSQFWAGDWNDEFRMIEFAEAGELDALEQALTADLESYGLTGYHFEGEVAWA